MCPTSIILALTIIFAVALIIFLHICISQKRVDGNLSDVYVPSIAERFISALPVILFLMFILLLFTINDALFWFKSRGVVMTPEIKAALYALFFGPITITYLIIYLQARCQVRKWLVMQNFQVLKIWGASSSFSNPFCRSTKYFPSRSDSQSVFSAEIIDSTERRQTVHILWGGYFGLSWLTGKIPAELVFDDSIRLEKQLVSRKIY